MSGVTIEPGSELTPLVARTLPHDVELVRELCERILRQNWREGVMPDGTPFAFTAPSVGHYPWQFYWDSCFTAITWRHFDPERSRRELESLLAAQRPDGFIGHTLFWNRPLTGGRRFTYNVVSRNAAMTSSIQPPALAWAWRLAIGDPAAEPRIMRHHEWLAEHRDLDGDGLLWIVQPDESGLDASPQFDPIWRHRAHGLPGFVRLVARNRRLGYDLHAIDRAGGPVVCEVTTNVLYNLSRLALGLPSLTQTLIDRCYDERRGLFMPLTRPAPDGRLSATIAALTPLALPDLPDEIGRRLVEEHLLAPDRFWAPVPPTSVSQDDPRFRIRDTGYLHQLRYWRGPTWINTAWLCWIGLRRLGYNRPAAELARRLAATILRSGLREYYNPYTGSGMGAIDFGWSTLILEMI
jgi:Glycosyl hydrolase family 63 C-terminal domain